MTAMTRMLVAAAVVGVAWVVPSAQHAITPGLYVDGSGQARGPISFGDAPATTGIVRLSNSIGMTSRNAANTGNLGIIGTNAADQVTLGSLNAQGVLMQALAAAPANPVVGVMYVDTTAGELCFYDGAAWQGISSGTDANCS